MRKIKYLVGSLLLLSAMANANPVLQNTAATVAGNYYEQTYKADAGTLSLVYTERDDNGQAVYYVFDATSNNGFVIVSAEDAGYPIIGSSNTGHYVIPTSNNNVGFWMTRRKNEIIAMRTNNVRASSDISDTWNAYIRNTPRNTHQATSGVNALCTTTWDQEPYYNSMCPGGSVTGCVATAMAQIMKFWSYPTIGLSSWCYYDEPGYGFVENYGQLCAKFDTTHYVWSAMPASISSINHQLAKLMYDCGVSVDMNYSPSGSAANVIGVAPSAQNSYVEFFNYESSTIQGITQADYTISAWVAVIENELNYHRPVQYEGTDPVEGGHSWVCDGYNSSGEFHMNWGWSGQDDGYFSPTNLNPGGAGGYNFSEDVGAVIGIQPPWALGVSSISNNQSFKIYPNPGSGIFNISLENIANNPQITVYNVLGQQVFFSKLTNIQTNINLSNQPKGVYIYRVLNENGESVSTGRLIIE